MELISNKRKIFNDPVYGFITIPDDLIFDVIEHSYFQRLRRIKQLGLTHLVYPGALHTRFHHALGAMHLTNQAISVLRSKGHDISNDELQGALLAILLHDIGHGPYSHALEPSLVCCLSHEKLSELFINKLNKIFNNKLTLALKIYKNEYHKKFLHQLVSSQLDMDRLDYLKRDSFFTGVSEGVIGTERIIKMLNVFNGKLVVDEKGIYSIEKFIISRRLMYWQVYYHKTVFAAENMLIKILKRAKFLAQNQENLFATPSLDYFLKNNFTENEFNENEKVLDTFALLDDFDIYTSIKVWSNHNDKILSFLCKSLVNRHLYKTEIQNQPFEETYIDKIKQRAKKIFQINNDEVNYFIISKTNKNNAYTNENNVINILNKKGETFDIAIASDQLNISVLSKTTKKYFLSYPKKLYNCS